MTSVDTADPSACLRIGNDLSELTQVGAWINAWAQRHCVPSRIAERLDLCSSEAVTNVMMHAYVDGDLHEISLRLAWHGGDLALEIQDDGAPFDPTRAVEPEAAASLEEAHIGGWGIHLMRSLSNELRYRRANGHNHLTLVFKTNAVPVAGKPQQISAQIPD